MNNPIANKKISLFYYIFPEKFWPYIELGRFEKPIGWQLLMWPSFWMTMIASYVYGKNSDFNLALLKQTLGYLCLFLAGSIVMRAAGCVWNDLVDQDIDQKVERTKNRPLASKQISQKRALFFMILLSFVGLLILLKFNLYSIYLGLSSILLILIYPFMKRLTNWPQLILGLVFNWGALLGWSVYFSALDPIVLLFYFGCVCWTIGYDTIYAHQDKDDDMLIGLGSTALYFGNRTKLALLILYSLFLLSFFLGFYLLNFPIFIYIFWAIVAAHMGWQIMVLDTNNTNICHRLFISNNKLGLILFVGLAINFIAYYF